jgi:hypothetical protein
MLAGLALALIACSSPTASSAVPDQDFDLRAGESARLEGSDLVVAFESVPSDSRCPVDVHCVHAGDATVRLRVQGGGAAASVLELHTNAEPKEGAQGSFLIRLIGLRPLPRDGRPVAATEFVATLKINPKP